MIVAHDIALLPQASAVFSECGGWRYWLQLGGGGDLLTGDRRILWGLCNPSVAGTLKPEGGLRSDKTISTCVGFGERLGANRHGFLNLLGRIGTDPESVLGCPDPDGPDNGAAWEAAFDWLRASAEPPILIFAWGGKLWHERQEGGRELLNARSRSIARAFALADHHGITPQALGLTAGGAPRHPSRLGYEEGLGGLQELNGAWRRANL